MTILTLTCQDLRPQLACRDNIEPQSFFHFQPLARQAIEQFIEMPFGTLLLLKANTLPDYFSELQAEFRRLNSEIKLITKTECNENSLFGNIYYSEKENKLISSKGILQDPENEVLILNLSSLLAQPLLWDKLKNALLFHTYEPNRLNPIPSQVTELNAHFKLVLVGNREEIATLAEYDPSLFEFSFYSEIHDHLHLGTSEFSQADWTDYVQTMAKNISGKCLTASQLAQILQQAVRESESQQDLIISPAWFKKHLTAFCKAERIYNSEPQAYFAALEQQAAQINRLVQHELLSNQIRLETEGEKIGQINGLSIVEYPGVPQAFGEPLRISCNVQYGEGEIVDVERKVELGGNLHAKGIMIAQSCLAQLADFPTQLPFAASLAFEQSYGEIDGDSSALAIFSVLVSALSQLPLPQGIALTGSLDQLGNVQSVGGVNQKIEGFFQLCQARGLNGKQGVILPSSCLAQLSLNQAVYEAVEAKQFQLWAVDDVFDVMNLLFARDFFHLEKSPYAKEASLFELIHQQINEHENENEKPVRWWQRLRKNWKR